MQSSWETSYEEFQSLFLNNFTLRILLALSRLKNMCGSASEIASILGIHISTTKKYLDLLTEQFLLEKKAVPDKPGRPTYYTLKSKELNLNLDLERMSQNFQVTTSIPNIFIREKKGIYPKISLLMDKRGFVQSIKVRKKTKAQRYVTQKIELSSIESRFFRLIPHPTMEPESFDKLCIKAKITDHVSQKLVFNFVLKLLKLGIVKKFHETEIESRSNGSHKEENINE